MTFLMAIVAFFTAMIHHCTLPPELNSSHFGDDCDHHPPKVDDIMQLTKFVTVLLCEFLWGPYSNLECLQVQLGRILQRGHLAHVVPRRTRFATGTCCPVSLEGLLFSCGKICSFKSSAGVRTNKISMMP